MTLGLIPKYSITKKNILHFLVDVGKAMKVREGCFFRKEDIFLGDEKGFMKKIPFQFYTSSVFFILYVGNSKYQKLLI